MGDFLYLSDVLFFVLARLSVYYLRRKKNSYAPKMDFISIIAGDFFAFAYLGLLFIVSPWHEPLALFLSSILIRVIIPKFIGSLFAILAKIFINVILCIIILIHLSMNIIGDMKINGQLTEALFNMHYILAAIGIVVVGCGISLIINLKLLRKQ